MKQPTFLEGVGVAIAASLAGSVLYTALNTVFPGGPVFFPLGHSPLENFLGSFRLLICPFHIPFIK